MNIYKIIENYLKESKTGAIATVISKDGSAPRDVGAKMFVGEDGKIYGTIGGGYLEFDVHKQAMDMIGEDKPKIIHIQMDGEEVASNDMICGGNVDVLVEPVVEEYNELCRCIEYLKKRGKNGILITRFNNGTFSKTIIEEDMNVSGDDISEEGKKILLKHLYDTDRYTADGTIVETLHISPTLYIFGAGHVSQFIAKVAKMVGFYVVVIDDRVEFANKDRFHDADEILVKTFQTVFNQLRFTGKEFVVIVTRGHQYDADVLKEALKRETNYVGMIGSKRKVKMIFDQMKEYGFDDETIKKVYSPIGLSINAETPQEIAVSIVAELVKVRRED